MIEIKERSIVVEGKSFDDIPIDLYIPPDYLEIFLERFEGPLDLLLYLIRKRNFDIINLPIVKITEQYLEYLRDHLLLKVMVWIYWKMSHRFLSIQLRHMHY